MFSIHLKCKKVLHILSKIDDNVAEKMKVEVMIRNLKKQRKISNTNASAKLVFSNAIRDSAITEIMQTC